MTENFARYKIHTGITTSCREQRTLAPGMTKRQKHKATETTEKKD
ncbi:MAG TPA: hypothetical protein O0X27_02395 [Methanocorpusculum sp.]|nr:hypothetical protein [Methanocorpusculum sp.]